MGWFLIGLLLGLLIGIPMGGIAMKARVQQAMIEQICNEIKTKNDDCK